MSFNWSAEYGGAAFTLAQLPPDFGKEIACAGRSNSGKSSIVNAVCNNKKLMRISQTPGCTKAFHFVDIHLPNVEFVAGRIADMPGLGYAKASKKQRRQWKIDIFNYLEYRQSLVALWYVLDCRHGAQRVDEQMLEWLQESNWPVSMLLSKSDKVSKNHQAAMRDSITRQFGFPTFCISARKLLGIATLQAQVSDVMNSAVESKNL